MRLEKFQFIKTRKKAVERLILAIKQNFKIKKELLTLSMSKACYETKSAFCLPANLLTASWQRNKVKDEIFKLKMLTWRIKTSLRLDCSITRMQLKIMRSHASQPRTKIMRVTQMTIQLARVKRIIWGIDSKSTRKEMSRLFMNLTKKRCCR